MRRRIGSGLLGAYVLVLALANVGVAPAQRITAAAGLDQVWEMFAPEPLQHEVVLEAEVRFADGSVTVWQPPRRGALLAPAGYRMEMWASKVARDDYSELWQPAAAWVARQHETAHRRPVSVTLRRRWRPVPRPGQMSAPQVWNEFDFYVLDLR